MKVRPRGWRHKDHKLTLEWSGEYGQEASSTGTCKCGWEESCSSQAEVRNEYGFHLQKVFNQTITFTKEGYCDGSRD